MKVFLKNITNIIFCRNRFMFAGEIIVYSIAVAFISIFASIMAKKNKIEVMEENNPNDDVDKINTDVLDDNADKNEEKVIFNDTFNDTLKNLEQLNKKKIDSAENDLKYDVENVKIKNDKTDMLKIKKMKDKENSRDNEKNDLYHKKQEYYFDNFEEKKIIKTLNKLKNNNEIIVENNASNNFATIYNRGDNGILYIGGFNDNKINGRGTIYAKSFNGEYTKFYEGNVTNGAINNEGTIFREDGSKKFKGYFINNKKSGKGEEYYENDILKFEGFYHNDNRNGKGKEYYESGKIKTEANWENGEIDFCNKITEYYDDDNNPVKFEGFKHFYSKNKEEKECKEYYPDGTEKFSGTMNDGRYWNGILTNEDGTKKKVTDGYITGKQIEIS